jgi:hypothetical protein
MLAQIDQNGLAEILATIEKTYTKRLGWDASTAETNIEGAVVDDVHQQLFNGEPPPEFAAPYTYDPTEDPRKTLTKHRWQEIKTFLQRNWQGAGGVILAEEMIERTISTVIADHRQRHSLQR